MADSAKTYHTPHSESSSTLTIEARALRFLFFFFASKRGMMCLQLLGTRQTTKIGFNVGTTAIISAQFSAIYGCGLIRFLLFFGMCFFFNLVYFSIN